MMIELMNNYILGLGAGYQRTMTEVANALGACFSLLNLFGSILNWYLLRQQVSPSVMTGLTFVALFAAWKTVRE